jgi:hypothetical protein
VGEVEPDDPILQTPESERLQVASSRLHIEGWWPGFDL